MQTTCQVMVDRHVQRKSSEIAPGNKGVSLFSNQVNFTPHQSIIVNVFYTVVNKRRVILALLPDAGGIISL